MQDADKILAARGEKLTPLRQRVLEILTRSPEPLSAYQLLEMMADGARKPAPPTVYRTLDFLLAQGLVHKIHSKSTFLPCMHAERPHDAELFLCRTCGGAEELAHDPTEGRLADDARCLGFAAERVVVEVEGVCQRCRSDP